MPSHVTPWSHDPLEYLTPTPHQSNIPFQNRQVLQILGLFTFFDEQIKILEGLKPFIHDAQNKHTIVASFKFDSEQKQAEVVLRDCRVQLVPPTPPAEKIQAALKKVGRCPAGYQWRQVKSGWRCSAGGHFVSDAKLEAAMAEK